MHGLGVPRILEQVLASREQGGNCHARISIKGELALGVRQEVAAFSSDYPSYEKLDIIDDVRVYILSGQGELRHQDVGGRRRVDDVILGRPDLVLYRPAVASGMIPVVSE